MFGEILEEILLEGTASAENVCNAIDNHTRVIINYRTKGRDKANGARVIEPYAYGLTKAGNPVIRAFQPFGDSTTRVPEWKFFRLDRIKYWKETGQRFFEPPTGYPNLGKFNPKGDDTMSVVYKVAKFGSDNEETSNQDVVADANKSIRPKTNGDVYKTDTERQQQKLMHQQVKPITLSDIKTANGFRDFTKEEPADIGPKTNADAKPSEYVNKDNQIMTKNELDKMVDQRQSEEERLKQQQMDDLWKQYGQFANNTNTSAYDFGDEYDSSVNDYSKRQADIMRRRNNRVFGTDKTAGSADKRKLYRKGSYNDYLYNNI